MFANSSSRSFNRSSSRHRGQALLLAVLIMLFVALLGTTFVAVVAINIGQTSRQEERDKAHVAAQAGLAFANQELTYSEAATKWRPEQEVQYGTSPVNPGPPPATDTTYWTPFDQAQGWAGNGNTDPLTGQIAGSYVKFPDPRSQNQNLSAPNYMVSVESVAVGAPDNSDGDKTGDLRISVIGQSSDDPNSFSKLVAYKAGPAQTPFTGAMRSVSNWDFDNGVVPSASVASYDIAQKQITFTGSSGSWPATPFYVMIGDPITNVGVRSALVTDVDTASGTLTLSATPSPTPTLFEHVELAGALGAPVAVDYNNDNNGIGDPSTERVDFKVSQPTNPVSGASVPGSTLVNGGLVWYGNAYTQNLLAPRLASTSLAPGSVKSSGLIECLGTVNVAGTYDNGGSGALTSGTLQSSNGSFPFIGSGSSDEKNQLVEDGANRMAGSTDPTRQDKPFTPPDITSGGGLGRYRQFTKYSDPASSSYPPQAAAYGYGQGVYINNYQDKERTDDGSGNLVEMDESQLHNLWFSTAATSSFMRLGTPDANTLTNKSLEQMHLRGWVGPDEFRARGALVELIDDNPDTATSNDPALKITLDARDENTAADTTRSQGPVAEKAWLDSFGNSLGAVYTQYVPWPANGVLFAEGNVRIRGSLTNDPLRSLTVVSMNNIYIEDSLGADIRKVLLLAKKNVIVNPTRVLGRPDVQTLVSANSSGSSLSVYDGNAFEKGDIISVATSSGTETAIVNIPGTNSLTLQTALVGTASANAIVRTVSDPVDASGLPYNNYANRLDTFNGALLRRVDLPVGATQMRLAMRHSAEYRPAFQVAAQQGTTPGGRILASANLTNKLAGNANTGIIESKEKMLKVDYTDSGGTPPDKFPSSSIPAFASETDAQNYRIGDSPANGTRDDLYEDLKQQNASNSLDWQYLPSVQKSYNTTTTPAYFLAAVGNRSEFYAGPTSPTPNVYPLAQTFFPPDTTSYTIPMATSIYAYVNGGQAVIKSDYYSSDLYRDGNPPVAGFETVNQFGFNFTHGLGVNNLNTADDVLTTDQSFYRNGYGSNYDDAANGDKTYYSIDNRTLNNAKAGDNALAFRLNPDAQNYFGAATADPRIPFYRLARVKLENTTPDPLDSTTHQYENLAPGSTLNINAYVYAQDGSWLVIPGGYFDSNIKTDATGAYELLADGTTKLRDLGRNNGGMSSRADTAAAYRFLRYNYQINFNGAIMENQSATVIDPSDPTGSNPLYSQVQSWTDKWATVKIAQGVDLNGDGTPENNWSGSSSTDTLLNNLSTDNGNFATIKYSFDPDAALSALNPASTLNTDDGFHPPISPELIYQSG